VAIRVQQINAVDDDDLDEDDDDDYDGVPNKTETEFVNGSNSIKLLCAMCVGIKDDKDVAIFDLDNAKYSRLNKKEIKPSRGDYTREVERRVDVYSHDKIRPKNWTLPRASNGSMITRLQVSMISPS
jgi:hypothetical protein